MAVQDEASFTVTDVSKTRRGAGENLFTGMKQSTEVFTVRTTSTRFPDRHLDLSFGSEGESQKFSKGQVYTLDELMELFLS